MLSAWNNEYHHRNHHLELRLKKLGLRLNRWWIYYRYSGNPNKDPYMLTSRPRNIPLISLRTEEYSEFLSNKEYVGQRWDDFWRAPGAVSQKVDYQRVSYDKNHRKMQRVPLRELKYNERPRNVKPINVKNFDIYHDDNNVIGKENLGIREVEKTPPKKLSLNTIKQKGKKSVQKPLQLVNEQVLEDDGLLDSFERELIASTNCTLSRGNLFLPFGDNKHELKDISTPVHSNYQCEIKEDRADEQNKTGNKTTISFNFDSFKHNPQINIIESARMDEIDLDKEFDYESFYPNEHIKRVVTNKLNYDALGFDGDRIAVQNKIKGLGLKGRISNKIRPESRSTFDNRLTLDSHPVRYNFPQRLPLIQRPEFFDRSKLQSKESKYSNKNHEYVNDYRQYQVKNYIRSAKLKREKRKDSRKRTLSKKKNDTEKDRAITVLKRIKDNTREKLWDTLVSVPVIQNNELGKDFVEHIEKRSKKHLSKSGFHNWRIFNGHRYARDVDQHHVDEANHTERKQNEVAKLRQFSNFEAIKIPKVVKIVSPPEGEGENKENWPEGDACEYVEEYDIIADYEDLSD
ncbi:hypothetical protein PMKS-001623 [Pichia membranifaciens]|uniref:Uncharacterized protein n=1 Tax=Pichia membranifaciens TaxID=4926 RepID=A0A1Q2YF52_9ASCO|nr:hypothetical protein PMKS-001623 [Pichia membranifaciens]